MTDSGDDRSKMFAALKSGARACLNKEVQPDKLLDTVRKVARGEYPIIQEILDPSIASQVIDGFEIFLRQPGKDVNPPVRLSPIETQILHHVARGEPVEDVVRELGISEDTLRQRLYIIRGKLAANDRFCSRTAIA